MTMMIMVIITRINLLHIFWCKSNELTIINKRKIIRRVTGGEQGKQKEHTLVVRLEGFKNKSSRNMPTTHRTPLICDAFICKSR